MSTVTNPVGESERAGSVDALRGFALLGILVMNITAFSLPLAAYMNPRGETVNRYAGEFRGANAGAWVVQHVFFDMKMMTIFSMLFGAGLALMSSRAGAGSRFAGVYYRRCGWLLLIGLLHAYLIWFGDILTLYAICGFALYPLRRLPARRLILIGSLVLMMTPALSTLMGFGLGYLRGEAIEARALMDAGEEPSASQKDMLEQWEEMNAEFNPAAETVEKQIADMRGSYGDVLAFNAELALQFQTFYMLIWGLWRALGSMLLGMALMKLGVFSAERSRGFYVRLGVVSYAIGLPLVAVSAYDLAMNGLEPVHSFKIGAHFNYFGSLGVALGHVAVVMLVWKSGTLSWLMSRLAAVGRMAFTNYLMQSVICTTIYFGWGFGLFATMERWETMGVVAGVWIVQLAWSPWWLARFRFGPAEWAWRTLTYGRRQPMRRREPV